MNKILGFTVVLFCLWISAALAGPTAFVTIAPQKYFVDKVSGSGAPVSIMVEAGANPHAYEPKPRQMAELAKAKIYFTIGDTFDQVWLDRITGASPGITVVHTEEGIAKIPMAGHGHHEDSHGHSHDADHKDEHDHDAKDKHGHDHDAEHQTKGEHSHDAGHKDEHDHGSLDPHIWLDPKLVKIQAGHIRDGLTLVDPQQADLYAANTARFEQELDALDQEIRSILAAIPEDKRTFLVFHPSWGYFAQTYGLRQVAIEVQGKEPSPKDMARIIKLGKESGARVVFVQPQFSEKSAATIASQIGATVVRLDPLAEDWSANMRRAAQAFADALR